MSGKKKKMAVASGGTGRAVPERFRTWSWDDFAQWTDRGSVERGKSYVGNVEDEGMASDGRIVATVHGTHAYATEIRVDADGSVHGRCSCPVGSRCKHTVALILKCIGLLEKGQTLPSLDDDDWRLEELDEDGASDWDDDGDDEWEEEDDAGDDEPEPPRGTVDNLETWLDSLHAAEAKRLLKSIVATHRDVRGELQRRLRNEGAGVSQLLAAARRELEASRRGHYHGYGYGWDDAPCLPDCSKLLGILRELHARKAGRALADFGETFIGEMTEQIESIDDDGEASAEIAPCMDVIAAAVREAPDMTEAEKLRWFADVQARDEYGLCGEDIDPYLHPDAWSPAAWSDLADELTRRLSAASDGTSSYHRDQHLRCLCRALENAGRADEARATRIDHYLREGRADELAKLYLAEGDFAVAWDTAAQAATAAATRAQDTDRATLSDLRLILRDIARRRGDGRLALALQAEDFFVVPSADAFRKLLDAAAPDGLADVLRGPLLRFLETGIRPLAPSGPRRQRNGWPLPPSGVPENLPPRHPADVETGPSILLQIALGEKNPDEILRRWNALPLPTPSPTPRPWWRQDPREEYRFQVADALATDHPVESLRIWDVAIEELLPRTGKHNYEQVSALLCKARKAMKRLGRTAAWTDRIRQIRERYRNRRLFLEILSDHLDAPNPSKPIFGTTRKR